MIKNVGKVDRIGRLVLGIVIIAGGLVFSSWRDLVGVGIILPALIGYDPLYSVIGFNSNKKQHERRRF